ncbi:MAG: hypothetical protein QNJ97_05930 [Myxococcota bacterium]|nr:hypothetical protein [Myxococcota bacterium]
MNTVKVLLPLLSILAFVGSATAGNVAVTADKIKKLSVWETGLYVELEQQTASGANNPNSCPNETNFEFTVDHKHILSALMTAWIANKHVVLFISDSECSRVGSSGRPKVVGLHMW